MISMIRMISADYFFQQLVLVLGGDKLDGMQGSEEQLETKECKWKVQVCFGLRAVCS